VVALYSCACFNNIIKSYINFPRSAAYLPILLGFSEIPSLFSQRPILHRHKRAAMYYPFIEALTLTFVDIPFIFVTIALYCILLYFMVQLQQTPGQFFFFYLTNFVVALVAKIFFRAVASTCRTPAPAQAMAGLTTIVVSLYSGMLTWPMFVTYK
jgi:ATP-binding cassette, subfamily G (WHITE), member 2, SNQ2